MFKRFTSHSLMALAEASLIALLVVGLIAGTAFAGKGGGKPGGGGKPSGGGGTIELHMIDGADNLPNFGERAEFIVWTTATTRPFVGVRCFQDGVFMYDSYTGYFAEYMYDPWVILNSPYWNAAAPADCTARLFYNNSRGVENVLATTSFVVQP